MTRRLWCWMRRRHQDRLVMVAWGVGDWRPVTMCLDCKREVSW